jgi:regulator of RNase E activity RraA
MRHWAGGAKLSRVENHRLAGVLADGRLRDFAELERYDLAIYCRGETTRWGGDAVTPYEANRPVVVAGVVVRPGDYVFADASGAAVIPAGEVRAVLRAANQVAVDDAAAVATIRGEALTTLGDNEKWWAGMYLAASHPGEFRSRMRTFHPLRTDSGH